MKPPSPAAAYAILYPQLAEIARHHGYTLAIHGSMTRDLDLIAVPWVDDAGDPQALVAALTAEIGGYVIGNTRTAGTIPHRIKPHGRRAWTIHWEASGEHYIDLSVMPRLEVR